MNNINKFALAAAISSLLVACGGGSSGSSEPSSSSSTSSSSSMSSTSSAPAGGGLEYEGDWASCERFNDVQGFASLGGGTTGGADMGAGNYEVGVTNASEISAALTNANYLDKPLTIYVDDFISGGQRVDIQRSNVTLIGRSENAGLEGVPIVLRNGASNVIIRNLILRLVPQSVDPGDIISLDGRNGAISNVWIDHNELYNSLTAPQGATCANSGLATNCDIHKDYYDELVSGRSAVHNVTISYNYLHDAWKTSLWGSSDNVAEEDVGRTITFHHNYWKDTNSRLPLFRFGEGHVFNSYYRDVNGTGINSRMGAVMRIDGNVFENVSAPITSRDSAELGYWDVEDNTFINITASGSCNSSIPPCNNAHELSTTTYVPPYNYYIMPSGDVKDYVLEFAGANKITECLNLPEVEDPGVVEPKDPPETWNMYSADNLPDAEGSLTLADGSAATFVLGGDEGAYFGVGSAGTVTFDTTENAGLRHHANYLGVVNDQSEYPKHLTVLAGVTGNTDGVRVLEIEVAMADDAQAGSRLKTILRADGSNTGVQLEQANFGESVDNYNLDMSVFRVYQISVTLTSATTGTVHVYGDGDDTPLISLLNVTMRETSIAGDNFIRFGDGGSHPYKSTVDWLVWSSEDAYRPSDLKGALPEGLGDITGYEAEE